MATEPADTSDKAASGQPSVPIRHQQGRAKVPDDDACADDAASQQQQ